MVRAEMLLLPLLLACLSPALPAHYENHLVTAPQSPVLQIGSTFTATCTIINTAEVTSDDLYWNVSKTIVPKEQYTRINGSALNVTITVKSESAEWLFCLCKKKSPYVTLNKGKFVHGIHLKKGYLPGKPENLSCIAVQDQEYISSTMRCEWKPVGPQTPDVPTTYRVFVLMAGSEFNVSTRENHAEIQLNTFPYLMNLDIWVEAHNELGTVKSDHLQNYAEWYVKTNPPSPVEAIAEKDFPRSLLIRWHSPIHKQHVSLKYQIRFCPGGSHHWTYVPLEDIAHDITSFRLQNLQPDTFNVIQMRCKSSKVHAESQGYWSDWSANTTTRTPEDRPTSKPDVWAVVDQSDSHYRRVWLVSKDPVSANGKIIKYTYNITIHGYPSKNESSESIAVNSSETDGSSNQRKIAARTGVRLGYDQSVRVDVTASNSVGTSPAASLTVPPRGSVRDPVRELIVMPQRNTLWLQWKPPPGEGVSEYVVVWVAGEQMDWQRENRSTTHTLIKGNLEKFVCYNVSVYPIYYRKYSIGKPAMVEAFVEQGAPLEGPAVRLMGKPTPNKVVLEWNQIPLNHRRGFITNYTIFYSSRAETHNITVPADVYSYTLMSLSSNTKYDVWVRASTVQGSTSGTYHSFTTPTFAQGTIELIVVGVSLGFLFVVVMTTLLCVYKKDAIKKNFWPQIPNPGDSTIGNWSPDYPLKAETSKEKCLSGISVLDVDVCDRGSVYEEDKASLALRKDKYLSEEHSSGIGGSSCMSSPRQSVSDNDDSGDMGDTTASTVQYSSVVASGGYKGQTPGSQPQQAVFTRSESTQPLLESEEHPDMFVQEGSRQSARFPRQTCFSPAAANRDGTRAAELEELEALDFCPLEEDAEPTAPPKEQSADWQPPAPSSSYMPQLGGYRPQ
ncbi:interleukin-6 receptor subunit beta [Betta splendens]|uniref:Interleukin-6 receptor subunit beta n=1 Tax=Betta splendens TaxID=158456 RepID=A0A6P7P800_BETSP|nr:interleukin-6 receptor subunit beta [Betta splendens]XP_029025637.1 interleukin-6 receptor subunit beta [Betta splendens]XP_029025638.1 interleukin-6 receptor subunit beta [Betta splendens]